MERTLKLQAFYQRYALEAAKLFPLNVWRLVNAVQLEPKTTQSKVLQAVVPMLSSCERTQWPMSRQQIDKMIVKKLGPCYTRVKRTVSIDLSHIGLAGLTRPLEFTFIDPLFAWSSCADKLSREHPLHFKYEPLYHPTSGELLYGASVRNGKIMQQACAKLPVSPPIPTGAALIGLSWDAGLASRRRSYTPILISVGNTDYSGMNTCSYIGYLPQLPLSKQLLSSDKGKRARHELVQACAGAIINVLERHAQHGFKAYLHDV